MAHSHSETILENRPKLEVADIFRRYSHLLGPLHLPTLKVVQSIVDCRTAKLGGHIRQCTDCAHEEQSYNSCRNRHCPKCQFLSRADWVNARMGELLPVEYFHSVMTVPHLFNPITLYNKKIMYSILFRSGSETIKEVAKNQLGVETGFISVLHTWGQTLVLHPHLHIIVPGGGLSKVSDGVWVPGKKGYLLPTKILSQVFRGKFLQYLEESYSELVFPDSISDFKHPVRFKHLLEEATTTKWVVYAKKPFAGPEHVLNYLGNYTHRIAISNHRIVKMEDDHIHFRYKDYRTDSQKIMVLHAAEFMRRFLLHVLPPKFIRIRHYGFLGSRLKKTKLELIRKSLNAEIQADAKEKEEETWHDKLKKITGIDATICVKCKKGKMVELEIIPCTYMTSKRQRKKRKWMDSS